MFMNFTCEIYLVKYKSNFENIKTLYCILGLNHDQYHRVLIRALDKSECLMIIFLFLIETI